jgi:hypothetical protein
MRITTKYHLILIFALLIGLVIISSTSYYILQRHAREEVIRQASVLMEAALAMRKYTITEIKPLLALQNKRDFLPQSVPSYAATQNFEALRKSHSEYRYKEATLNPTNPRDRAVDWEADIIQEFRNNANANHMTLVRNTPSGAMLYYARPIRIKDQGCLTCHGMIGDAPETMINLYGPANGFGWKMNEVVGSQIVSVPLLLPVKRANETFFVLNSIVAGVFLALYLMFIFFFKRLFIHQAMLLTTVVDPTTEAINTTRDKNVTHERVVAQDRSVTQDRVVTQDRNEIRDRIVVQDRNIDQGRNATQNRIVAHDKSSILERNMAQDRGAHQDRNTTQDSHVLHGSDVTQSKEERPSSKRNVSREKPEEHSISLAEMYQKYEMDTSILDDTFEVEDVITELTLDSAQGRDKT